MIRTFLKKHPRLYDHSKKWHRALSGRRDAAFRFLDTFSREQSRPVHFLQIGASDGLRSDLVREFVVRDHWSGVFVEPLPYAFKALRQNYSYLSDYDLAFVDGAVSDRCGDMTFWTFQDEFLATLDLETRFDCLRKSSLHRNHVERFLRRSGYRDSAICSVKVKCYTVRDLVERYFKGREVDLLAIDAEGHDQIIIESIDFENPAQRPRAILFESHQLGSSKEPLLDRLRTHGYHIEDLGGDTGAVSLRSAYQDVSSGLAKSAQGFA